MADNFAVIVELNENQDARTYTVAAGTSISKGDLLQLSGDNTVAISSGSSDIYGGVAAADKDGTDSSTTLGVHVPGALNKFDMKCANTTVALGALVSISGSNLIKEATAAEILAGDIIGKAQEAGSIDEVITILS